MEQAKSPERSRVLVVEDVRHLAHFVRRNLERAGYQTRVVHRGDEVVAAVRAFRPHAILLDLVLPGMSGVEVCAALRGDPANEGLVVVVVTGHSFGDVSVAEVEAAGADWSFTKPLSPVTLLAKLAELGVPPRPVAEEAPSSWESTLRRLVPKGSELAFRFEEPCEPGLARVRWRPRSGGPDVWVCAPRGRDDLLALGASVASAAERLVEAERERDGLSRELALAYESLASIYEIGSDPSLLLSPERALSRIIDRALAFEADLRAVVWLLRDERLVPAQWRGTEEPRPRAVDGLVGRALAERRGIIVNRREPSGDAEPELARASRVAVSPLVCREEAIGAMVVWHEAPGEFDSRVMGLLAALGSHAAMILEQDRLRRETVEGARLRREVEIGGTIQRTLLFGRVPDDIPGVDLGTIAQASRQIDGDFFGFFRHSQRVFDVLVGDVMGKGVPAAIVGAAVKSQFARFAGGPLASGGAAAPARPRDIVAAVHDEVARQLIELGRFVTVVYARFDLDRGTMTYVDCGHPRILHFGARTGSVAFRAADPRGAANLPLGVLAEGAWDEVTVPIGSGDLFLFYSDGLTEATAPDGAMFGTSALVDAVARGRDLGAQQLAEGVHAAVTRFAAEDGLRDDLTCIVVAVGGGSPPGTEGTRVLEVPAREGQLARIRDFVRDVCAGIPGEPFDPVEVSRIQLGIVEAASNVVRHAYGPAGRGDLRLEASWDKGHLRFRLLDRGHAFDPSQAPEPSFDGSRDGGFGLFLIRKVMDGVSYGRDAGGRNCLELVRRLPVREPATTP